MNILTIITQFLLILLQVIILLILANQIPMFVKEIKSLYRDNDRLRDKIRTLSERRDQGDVNEN